jgi:hypothetical protein
VLSPRSVRQVSNTMGRVFLYAMQHDAITANPLERVDFSANRATGDRERFSSTRRRYRDGERGAHFGRVASPVDGASGHSAG